MESMASAIGVSIPVLRFLLCFVATIPVLFCPTCRLDCRPIFISWCPCFWVMLLWFSAALIVGSSRSSLHLDILLDGALMVISLKIISSVMNYQDGLLKEEDLREAQKKNRLLKLPSLLEYFGYCLCCGSHFSGPVYEIKDYLEYTKRNGIWKPSDKGQSLPFGATLRVILQAICGWSDMINPPKPQWDRAKNVDILGVELAKSSVQILLVWNIQVSIWLRHYVYERLIQKGRKSGFFQLLATQTVSAVWHGLYPGYIIFFVRSALMIAGSRVIYRWQQATNRQPRLVLNYSAVGFVVLSLHETITAYGSVYYIGTVVPILVIPLGNMIQPAKPVRSREE
ncbi:hypothetical protein K7X08_022257 [Anisodus acutangulus]|uniref:Uncharacterized protein n=1 Tax=Anisodus acutangulus TaxID=402998 RepID=A0A9Q1RJS6_9SOLA|nr:hypothetical protein K7X08_022257 [Anisodus acutangulus]